jgi:hypothetical protein
MSIDAKRRRLMGEAPWIPFATRTSIIAFAAIVAGHNRFSLVEIVVWRTLGGLCAYGLALALTLPFLACRPCHGESQAGRPASLPAALNRILRLESRQPILCLPPRAAERS